MIKIGPWGGNGGTGQDADPKPMSLISVTIRSSDVIYAISFLYMSPDGAEHVAGPWGGTGGTEHKFGLSTPYNYLEEVSGTVGKFQNDDIVTSLKFVAQGGKTYTYGTADGTPFHIPVLDGGKIEGFFGRSSNVLNAIGLYVKPRA